MKSAGNDIVALEAIDIQRSCNPSFYSKFIIPAEQALYNQAELPLENFVWLLWSVKESAYKYLNRLDAGLVFSPSKLIVQHIQKAAAVAGFSNPVHNPPSPMFYVGSIMHHTDVLYFQAVLNDQFIAAVVNDEPGFTHVYWGAQFINNSHSAHQSNQVRLFALNTINKLLPGNKLRIDKHPDGYPCLVNGAGVVNVPLSLAHHGHYVAWSVNIPK